MNLTSGQALLLLKVLRAAARCNVEDVKAALWQLESELQPYQAFVPMDPAEITPGRTVAVPVWDSGTVTAWAHGEVLEVRPADEPSDTAYIVLIQAASKPYNNAERLYFGYSVGDYRFEKIGDSVR